MSRIIPLAHRSLLRLQGPDKVNLLQGILTNDVRKLTKSKGIAAFILNSKGRIVEDVLVWNRGTDDLFIECERSSRADLVKHLHKYKLRKNVVISESEEEVAFSDEQSSSEYPDPRHSSFGSRLFGKFDSTLDLTAYNLLRYEIGIAEGRSEVGGLLPFQANGDFLNFVSLDKGCYIGQELTARAAHTGVIRRRILPFTTEGHVKHGADIIDESKKKVGKMIASGSTKSIGLLQLNAFGLKNLTSENVRVFPEKPSWLPDSVLEQSHD